jgi:hypothetical protein
MDVEISRSGAEPVEDALFDHWNPGLGAGSLDLADLSLQPGTAAVVTFGPGPDGVDSEAWGPLRPDLGRSAPGAPTSPRSSPAPDAAAGSGGDGSTTTTPVRGPAVAFPRLGESIAGFRIIGELGRGAFARVYLAHEAALGNRPVALKVSRAEGDEPRVLARLQHTHIVPIHSVVDDRATGLRLICMPYLGGANLAQVLDAASGRAGGSTRAGSLLDALDLIARPSPTADPPRPPRRAGPEAPASHPAAASRPHRPAVADGRSAATPAPGRARGPGVAPRGGLRRGAGIAAGVAPPLALPPGVTPPRAGAVGRGGR